MTRRLLIASSIYNGVLRLLAVACGAAVLAACHHDADAPATDDSFEADLAIAAGATLIRTGPLASLRAATRCNHLLRLA